MWLIKLTSLHARLRKGNMAGVGVMARSREGGGGMKRQQSWSSVLPWAIYLSLLAVLLHLEIRHLLSLPGCDKSIAYCAVLDRFDGSTSQSLAFL